MTEQATIATTRTTTARWSGYMAIRELRKPGGPLMAALYGCAAERDQMVRELAKKLDVTPGYLSQLRTGLRTVKTISADFSEACAKYLGISRVEVLVLAGQLTEDSCRSEDGKMVELSEAFAMRSKALA